LGSPSGILTETGPYAAGNTSDCGTLFVAAGPLSSNGPVDIVASDTNPPVADAAVLINGGGGNFQTPQLYSLGGTSSHHYIPFHLALGDANHDGILDLAAADDKNGALTLLFNAGGGTFGPPNILPLAAGDNPLGVAIADVNGDGWGDVIGVSPGSSTIYLFLNLHGGGFTLETYPGPLGALDVATGDFNHDGKADLAVFAATNVVQIYLGN
jgi:hypothetical protein